MPMAVLAARRRAPNKRAPTLVEKASADNYENLAYICVTRSRSWIDGGIEIDGGESS